jgi:hypothetical protein
MKKAKIEDCKVEALAQDQDPEQEKEKTHFDPDEKAFASLKFELRRPVLGSDTTATRAWQEIHSAQRAAGQAVQTAIGEVVVYVRDMRKRGKIRYPNKSEQANATLGIPLLPECYTWDDIKGIHACVERSLRTSGLSEYVYGSISRRIAKAEFTRSKLAKLLAGEVSYPVFQHVGIMMRSRNWLVRCQECVSDKGKPYLDIEIEISAIRKGLGRMVLHCCSIHGRQMGRIRAILEALQAMGWDEGEAKNPKVWSKGALTLRALQRPGQPVKWQILVPYKAPRVDTSGGRAIVVVHRSVVNMLSAAVKNERGTEIFHYPGKTLVALKHQMYARRAALSRDIASKPHRGRGGKAHYKALHRFADKEARATQTELWRATRWVQNIVERYGAEAVYLDDFKSFDPDRPGPPFEPYVRNFPFADLRLKVVDAMTRRAGVSIDLWPSQYISQRCPACGNIDAANIEKLPVVKGMYTEPGKFKCKTCEYFNPELDKVSILNQLALWEAKKK